jgi:hypothetical protein
MDTSKLLAILASMTFIMGAVAVYYSINLFLASPSQPDGPTSLRVSQWSGYIVASDMQNRTPAISRVSASWTVPEVKLSENNTFAGAWIGIGGYGEETLIQAGTEQECTNGRFSYYAWYELIPNFLIRIPNLRVRPGDTITASISLVNENASTWSIEMRDVTRGEQFEKVVVYNSSRLTAEWIVERPKVNGTVSTLADFGNVTFTESKATVNDITGTIGNFSHARLVMHDDEDNPLVSVSPLNDEGSVFTVSYLEPTSTTTLARNFITQRLDVVSAHSKQVPKKIPEILALRMKADISV